MINDKKGQIWRYLITGIIALVVIVVIVLIFTKGGDKAAKEIESKFDDLGDTDGDGIANLFDQCKGSEGSQKDVEVNAQGCPGEKTIGETSEDKWTN